MTPREIPETQPSQRTTNTRKSEVDFVSGGFGAPPESDRRWSRLTGWRLIPIILVITGMVAFFANLSVATTFIGDTYRSSSDFVSRLTASPAEKSTDQIVSEARHEMPWVHEPTIYKPSVEYLRTHFSEMDPYSPHVGDLRFAPHRVEFTHLFELIPAAAGQPITVTGRFRAIGLVEADRDAMSWAVELTDPKMPDAMLVVRVPTPTDLKLGYNYGERVTAQGVVLADGVAKNLFGKDRGAKRVIYFVARSVFSTDLIEEISLSQ